MTKEHSVIHATFTIERVYEAPPSRVFAAWAKPELKTRWFGAHDDWERKQYELDFRVGGKEININAPKGKGAAYTAPKGEGAVYTYNALYQDIIPDQRIIYSYDILMDEARISVSVATVELKPEGKGTRLIFTEQGAFLDGLDDPKMREEGTKYLLEALGKALQLQAANA